MKDDELLEILQEKYVLLMQMAGQAEGEEAIRLTGKADGVALAKALVEEVARDRNTI